MGVRHSVDPSSRWPVNEPSRSTDRCSDLYMACLDNDLASVQVLLETSPLEEVNTLEIDGSTALHLAVQLGHVEIVRLLLHGYEVPRHRTNSEGLTAFQLASTDELRQLFRRPAWDENRFCNVRLCSRTLTRVDSSSTGAADLPTGRRVERYQHFHTLREQHSNEVYAYYGGGRKPALKISDKRWLLQHTQVLSELLDQSTGQRSRLSEALLEEYSSHGRAEPLIRLYTSPTPFYNLVNRDKQSSECLASPIYNSLTYLHPRAFQGTSYRGLSLSPGDLQVYQWAAAKPSRSLVVETFCSSTRDMSCAKAFAEAAQAEGRMKVLMVFVFRERCSTAIQLERLSGDLPCISHFEDEQEVLILPRTSFYVTQVQVAPPQTVIYLRWSQLDREVDDYSTELAFLSATCR